jgi:hypothetical protein
MTRAPARDARAANPVLFALSFGFLIGLPIAAAITGHWWWAAGGPIGFVLGAVAAAAVDSYRDAHNPEGKQ